MKFINIIEIDSHFSVEYDLSKIHVIWTVNLIAADKSYNIFSVKYYYNRILYGMVFTLRNLFFKKSQLISKETPIMINLIIFMVFFSILEDKAYSH